MLSVGYIEFFERASRWNVIDDSTRELRANVTNEHRVTPKSDEKLPLITLVHFN